jgi:hypothetical protein
MGGDEFVFRLPWKGAQPKHDVPVESQVDLRHPEIEKEENVIRQGISLHGCGKKQIRYNGSGKSISARAYTLETKHSEKEDISP